MSDHLTSAELHRYQRGEGSPADLLAMDDHLSGCEVCRGQLSAGNGLAEWTSNLDADEETHLTFDQLVARVERRTSDADRFAVEAHLQKCESCREEAADLARFRDGRKTTRSPWRWVIPAAAAAAIAAGFLIFRNPQPAPQVARWEPPASWPQQDRAVVEEALRAGKLPFAPAPAELNSKPGTLLGPSAAPSFEPLSPLGTVVYADRPQFRWSALAGAKSYRVEIYSGDFQLAARSSMVQTTEWTPEKPLARGVLYRWQVIGGRAGKDVTVPAPPAAEARFRILDQAAFEAIERARTEPRGRLLAAVLLARSGLRDDALAELSALDPETRAIPEVQRLLNPPPQ